MLYWYAQLALLLCGMLVVQLPTYRPATGLHRSRLDSAPCAFLPIPPYVTTCSFEFRGGAPVEADAPVDAAPSWETGSVGAG